jgi:two-component system cell cycle sensor histidine kinase/response regulator CckA
MKIIQDSTNKDKDILKKPDIISLNEDLNVLIVDDDPVITKTVSKMIKSLGIKSFVATNGLNAIEFLDENKNEIDIIILDLIMPIMDGNEAFKEIKKRYPKIKIILSSGFTDKEISEELKAFEFEFLQKPYSREELKNILAKIM